MKYFILAFIFTVIMGFAAQEERTTSEENRIEDSKVVQTIHFKHDETILCSSDKPIGSSEQNTKCVVRINTLPDDSKFEFWFDSGDIVLLSKSDLIKLISTISSQSNDKK